METAIDFSKTVFVLVTGASRGIGRQIAIDISKKLCEGSEIVLTARSKDGLNDTATAIESANPTKVKVVKEVVDFSNFDLEKCENLFSTILSKNKKYEYGVIFHNAGSIGMLKKAVDMSDLNAWKKYFDLNLFSTIIMNNAFIKKIGSYVKKTHVINITSLCGRKPFPSLAMYGSGKAARDLYFSVVNVEEPKVTVLNYSPGPVKTDMVEEIVQGAEDDGLKTYFKDLVKEDKILKPVQTVSKLLLILEKGDYKSGDTIDYFDE